MFALVRGILIEVMFLQQSAESISMSCLIVCDLFESNLFRTRLFLLAIVMRMRGKLLFGRLGTFLEA